VVEYFLIVTAPVLVSASIYVCLTKLIAWAEANGTQLGERWWLGKRFILWTFISLDIVTTALQVAGASLIGHAESNRKDPKAANNVLLAGLAVQSTAFLTFLVLLGAVISRLCRNRVLMERTRKKKSPFILVLVVASILVFIRILFRLAETSQGVFGFLMTHEGFFAGLEFAPMVVALWLLAIFHPGRWPTNTMGIFEKTQKPNAV